MNEIISKNSLYHIGIGVFLGVALSASFKSCSVERRLSTIENILGINEQSDKTLTSILSTSVEQFPTFGSTNSYLQDKVGFRLSVDDLIAREKFPEYSLPGIGLFSDILGQRYEFEVKSYGDDRVLQTLLIANYSGDSSADSLIIITDGYNNGTPSSIYISDNRNNTSIRIDRNIDGEFNFTGLLDENSALDIFEYYSEEYNWFREKMNIDQRIEDYNPRFEVHSVNVTGWK
ncbi:MAG: hypothetical protein ACMXYG_04390 [Candidatus Woesearchaeota archaeon]